MIQNFDEFVNESKYDLEISNPRLRTGGYVDNEEEAEHLSGYEDDKVHCRIAIPDDLTSYDELDEYLWEWLEARDIDYPRDAVIVVWGPKDREWTSNLNQAR